LAEDLDDLAEQAAVVMPWAPGGWPLRRQQGPGALFTAVTKGGKVGRKALNPQMVYDVLWRRTAAAGVDHLSPHDLRRTFAGDLLDAGADLSVTQKLLGQASPVTSARYDRRGARAARAASDLLHVHYAHRPRGRDRTG